MLLVEIMPRKPPKSVQRRNWVTAACLCLVLGRSMFEKSAFRETASYRISMVKGTKKSFEW